VIVHVVLFRPRPDLTDAARGALADAVADAVGQIPSVRRAQVGRRVTHGRPYESLMRVDYSHAALFEFDDLAGLRTYLEHPAHEQMAARFFDAFEEALIYDYELEEGLAGVQALRDEAG
jgi:hypothetical protein